MTRLPHDVDKFGAEAASPLVEAFHSLLKDLMRRRLAEHGGDWGSFVFGAAERLIGDDEIRAIEQRVLDAGHRYAWSAMVSVEERPEAYVAAEGVGEAGTEFSFEHADAPTAPPDANGRELRGVGDNVARHAANVSGVALYIRTSAAVQQMMRSGVPDETIAIIDDSGGTLTAPILERFRGVICAGGTVRSHLGILTREYNIPCLMNAKISGIRSGDRVEIECTAAAKTAEAYQSGAAMTANIWRLPD